MSSATAASTTPDAGIAADRGAQALGERAAHRVGVDADHADPGGGQQLHHQLPDQPEPDDQRHVAELRLAAAHALHRDRARRCRTPRAAARARPAPARRGCVGTQFSSACSACSLPAQATRSPTFTSSMPCADLLDHPAQRVAQRGVGVELARHLAVGGGHPVGRPRSACTLATWSGRARALPSSDMPASPTFIISVPVEISE